MKQLIIYWTLIGVALSCLAGCQKCNSSQCLSCSSGYYLQNNTCSICNSNCNKCKTLTTCLTCNINFYNDYGICYPCAETCQICNSTVCSKCFNSYYLSNASCIQCDTSCVSCTGPVMCNSCISNYYVKEGACISCGDRCSNCLDEVGCEGCSAGYYVFDGKCQACKANCETCTQIICNKCYQSYYLDNNKQCLPCQNCRNVQTCMSKGECVQESSQQSKSVNLLLFVVVPLFTVSIFLSITYIIVFKVIKEKEPQVVAQSKGTLPTEVQIIGSLPKVVDLPNQIILKEETETSRQLNL